MDVHHQYDVWVTTSLEVVLLPICAIEDPRVVWLSQSGDVGKIPGKTAGNPTTDASSACKTIYKLTPRIWAWIVRTTQVATEAHKAGKLSEDEYTGALARVKELDQYVAARYAAAEVVDALHKREPLPEVPESPRATCPPGRGSPAAGDAEPYSAVRAGEVLDRLRGLGCALRVDRERLFISPSELPADVAAAVRQHREALIDALLAEEAATFDAAPRVDAARAVAMWCAWGEWNRSLGG